MCMSRKYDTICSSRIRILIFYTSRILDPEPQHCFITIVCFGPEQFRIHDSEDASVKNNQMI
jgi:hypothetical protein